MAKIFQPILTVFPTSFCKPASKPSSSNFLHVSAAGIPAPGPNLAKNHVVYKIDFVQKTLNFEAVRLAMNVDMDNEYRPGPDGVQSPYNPGKLLVKPLPFKRNSSSSARTFQVDIGEPDLTLKSLLDILISHRLHDFDFVVIDERYFGCRDFMAQSFLLFEGKEYINRNIIWSHTENPPTPFQSVIETLGMRWADGRIEVSPIDRGRFRYHERVEATGVPYAESRRSREISEIVRRT